MSEINALRDMRPALPQAELEAMRMAARERFVAGTRARQARRRWRLPVLAGGLTAAAAATAAAALVLTGPGAVPGQRERGGHTRTVVTAAWTVREDADGTVTIDLRQYTDPAGLQQTLQADGINAIVHPGLYVPWPLIVRGIRLQPLQLGYPVCYYAAADLAPQAVQRAVVTFIHHQGLPARFIIHPDAMPQGSALFLDFLAGRPRGPRNGNTGVIAWPPVVLNNDTVPTCGGPQS
jgi:hypothetical protein